MTRNDDRTDPSTEPTAKPRDERRVLVDMLPDAVIAIDLHHQITVASPRALEQFGYRPTDRMSGRGFLELVAPEARDLAALWLSKVLAEDRDSYLELEMIRQDGSSFPSDVGVAVIHDSRDKAAGLVAVIRDISGRRNHDLLCAQRDLALELTGLDDLDAALQACLRAALKVAMMDAGAVYLFHEETGLLEMVASSGLSPGFVRSTASYPPGSAHVELVLTGKPIYIRHQDLEVPVVPTRRSEGLKGMAAVPFHHDGVVIGCLNVASHTIEEFSSSRRQALESLAAQIGTSVAHLRAEQRLRKSEEKYRWLADNVTDVVWTSDLSLRQTYVSPSVFQQRGFTPEEVLAQSPDEVATKESALRSRAVLLAKLQGNPAGYTETATLFLDLYCKDGSTIPVEVNTRLTLDDQGKPNGIIGVSRDISERKRAEAERASIETQLRQAQKLEAIGTLAGGIAHDFNNLLTAILGSASVMRLRAQQGEDLLSDVARIECAARRAAELTGQLLGFARRSSLQRREPVDLNRIADEVVSILEHSLDKRIRIERQTDLERADTMGDPGQIEQVIMNLVVNASEAMPEGGSLTLATREATLDNEAEARRVGVAPGHYLITSVVDTGHGIPESICSRIFEPFFTTKPAGKGTGLGLATAYGIAKDHGGSIVVESTPDKGSTFSVYLPKIAE